MNSQNGSYTNSEDNQAVAGQPSIRSVAFFAIGVTTVIAYQLFKTANYTGNYEGMWFSLVHTVLVAIATVIALRQ